MQRIIVILIVLFLLAMIMGTAGSLIANGTIFWLFFQICSGVLLPIMIFILFLVVIFVLISRN